MASYCIYCGAEVRAESTFCSACGKPVTIPKEEHIQSGAPTSPQTKHEKIRLAGKQPLSVPYGRRPSSSSRYAERIHGQGLPATHGGRTRKFTLLGLLLLGCGVGLYFALKILQSQPQNALPWENISETEIRQHEDFHRSVDEYLREFRRENSERKQGRNDPPQHLPVNPQNGRDDSRARSAENDFPASGSVSQIRSAPPLGKGPAAEFEARLLNAYHVFISFDLSQLLASEAFGVFQREDPSCDKALRRFENRTGVSINDIDRVTWGGEELAVISLKKSITASDVQVRRQPGHDLNFKYKAVTLGIYTIFEEQFGDGEGVYPEFAFCLPASNVLIIGRSDLLRQVLEKGKRDRFNMQNALKRADRSAAVVVAVDLEYILSQPGAGREMEDVERKINREMTGLESNVSGLTECLKNMKFLGGSINTRNGIGANAYLRFEDEKSAEDCRKFTGVLMMFYKRILARDEIPASLAKEITTILDSVQIATDRLSVTADVKINSTTINNLIKNLVSRGRSQNDQYLSEKENRDPKLKKPDPTFTLSLAVSIQGAHKTSGTNASYPFHLAGNSTIDLATFATGGIDALRHVFANITDVTQNSEKVSIVSGDLKVNDGRIAGNVRIEWKVQGNTMFVSADLEGTISGSSIHVEGRNISVGGSWNWGGGVAEMSGNAKTFKIITK